MLVYKTLSGHSVDLSGLPALERNIAEQIIDLQGAWDQGTPIDFAVQARNILSSGLYRSHSLVQNRLSGSIGDIFRDCFYRIYGAFITTDRSEEEEPLSEEEFVQAITTTPARLIFDALLEDMGGNLDMKFYAHQVGLTLKQAKAFLDTAATGRTNPLTEHKALDRCFRTWQISPLYRCIGFKPPERLDQAGVAKLITGLSCVEQDLFSFLPFTTKLWCEIEQVKDEKERVELRAALREMIIVFFALTYDWDGDSRFIAHRADSLLTMIEHGPEIITLDEELDDSEETKQKMTRFFGWADKYGKIKNQVLISSEIKDRLSSLLPQSVIESEAGSEQPALSEESRTTLKWIWKHAIRLKNIVVRNDL